MSRLVEELKSDHVRLKQALKLAADFRRPARESVDMLHRVKTNLLEHLDKENRELWPVYGVSEKFQRDPHWRDLILFYEYFHGDNGAGVGASHQTGWTGCVAKLIELYCLLDPKRALEVGKQAVFVQGDRNEVKQPVS